ncbi:DUF6364 family protein [Hamadaea tsunoensis]|uniref:DUF6364 family protein n=1 Tax=Hamadaea tsunoensis TaxID=53368 RepID=UPI0012FAFC5A|nr:DUF6364 family protein [Hamadaea tsunoensis]
MTAKVTLSFSDDTIADARRYAERDGLSLSAWMDKAAKEKALRELFGAHADVLKRAGLDKLEKQALADEADYEAVSDVMRSRRLPSDRPRLGSGGHGERAAER